MVIIEMNPAEEDNKQQQEPIEKKLFENAMKNNWKEVIEMYRNRPAEAHKAKITGLGDTALHIAISNGRELVVEELVAIIKKYEESQKINAEVENALPQDVENHGALRTKNELGNTPLHLAAFLGNENMCYCIASGDPTLMGIRNKDKDTPLFLAVLHGRRHAYLSLTSLCEDSPHRYGYCRGKDGDTILHSAIDREYFVMAFHIIHHYEDLQNMINEKGFSPLHTLASKPSAFRSGSHFRGLDLLIYHCIFVDKINLDTTDPLAEGLVYNHKNPKYPENYQTCVGLFLVTRNFVRILIPRATPKNDANTKQESEKSNVKEEGQQRGDNIS